MNTQILLQTNKTNLVKRALFSAIVVGMALTTAPAASASAAACGLNPASQGWVPIQVTMEYEARCGNQGGTRSAPAKATTKLGCALDPATQGWAPIQLSMEYAARCK